MTAPPVPRRVDIPEDASSSVTALANCSNRLLDVSRQIAQPSEPLDSRWRRAWTELLEELATLEACLKSME